MMRVRSKGGTHRLSIFSLCHVSFGSEPMFEATWLVGTQQNGIDGEFRAALLRILSLQPSPSVKR